MEKVQEASRTGWGSGVGASRAELPEQPWEPGFSGWDERGQHSPDIQRFVRKLKKMNERKEGWLDGWMMAG